MRDLKFLSGFSVRLFASSEEATAIADPWKQLAVRGRGEEKGKRGVKTWECTERKNDETPNSHKMLGKF